MLQTNLYERHILLGAKIVEFGGWLMPLNYTNGIISEHLNTRKFSGIFDVSHMGRFIISGKEAVSLLQKVLTNNAEALKVGESHYTLIQNEKGCVKDDAYLYYFRQNEYLLVVNASNRVKDWKYFKEQSKNLNDIVLYDATLVIDMISLQGPKSKEILLSALSEGNLPEPLRNKLDIARIGGFEVLVGRTGYTGEPLCFELFVGKKYSFKVWDTLISAGALPAGLGARDTLRLEANMPLYGHELSGSIPVFASPLAKFAVSFSNLKGDFIGKKSLLLQFDAFKKIEKKDYSSLENLPEKLVPFELLDKGVARLGDKIYKDGNIVGYVTSGTAVPYWETEGCGISSIFKESYLLRSICIGLVSSTIWERDIVDIEVRSNKIRAIAMPYFLRNEAPPFARPITAKGLMDTKAITESLENITQNLEILIKEAILNNHWRQKECINLIPSEMTQSKIVKLLSVLDPSGRYAEHKKMKAFLDLDIFYYQGTEFIFKVEKLLKEEMANYLGCKNIEPRVISGQMANTVVFGALVDYLNIGDKKAEPRRIKRVINHHIIKGGHLSAQPMGALKDYVSIDPVTETPAVTEFPVMPDDPYEIDLEKTKNIILQYLPELIIFGKSVILYREPIKEIKDFIKEQNLNCLLLYDMAHVLGLSGRFFQEPFIDGADIVTGSTHKTFFGPQRGVIASDYIEPEPGYKLWEAVENRAFPGNVSNHHLGTLLGLLAAVYEMRYFKDSYQKQIICNAKAFAQALNENGLKVAGNSKLQFTQTHQVIIEVGFRNGPEIAARLEENNIITNFQATSEEEGFTASGAIRMGVAEMTRFGMKEDDFKELAGLMSDSILRNVNIKEKVIGLRQRFPDMKYCFEDKNYEVFLNDLINEIKN